MKEKLGKIQFNKANERVIKNHMNLKEELREVGSRMGLLKK